MFDKLAYSVGFFLGDGSLYSGSFTSSKNGKTYYHNDVVFVCSDLEPVEEVQKELELVFGKKYNMQTRILPSGLPHYIVTAHRREIFDFFSINTYMRGRVPEYYFTASKQTKLRLISGMMDTDGHCAEFVDRHDPRYEVKRWTLGFSNTKIELVQDLGQIMQSIGVKVGQITQGKKAGYRPSHIIHPNPRSFHEAGCYFLASRKQAKFDRYVDHVLGSQTLRDAPVTTGEDIVGAYVKA